MPNGVYAVGADGSPVMVEKADESCIGVALITNNQRIMIEKTQSYDATNTTFWWGSILRKKDVPGITETTDETVTKADFNGKDHTAAIIAAYTEHSVAMDARDMCSVLQTFNEGENNGGFTDWYIPSLGQLYEIFRNKTNINKALTAISGTTIHNGDYWSSSEYDSDYSWYMYFGVGNVTQCGKNYGKPVLFIRDLI